MRGVLLLDILHCKRGMKQPRAVRAVLASPGSLCYAADTGTGAMCLHANCTIQMNNNIIKVV